MLRVSQPDSGLQPHVAEDIALGGLLVLGELHPVLEGMAVVSVDVGFEVQIPLGLLNIDEEQVALLGLDEVSPNVTSHPIVANLGPVVDRVVVPALGPAWVRSVEVDLGIALLRPTLEDDDERGVSTALDAARQGVEHQPVVVPAVELLLKVAIDDVAVEAETTLEDVVVVTVAVGGAVTSTDGERGVGHGNRASVVVHDRSQGRATAGDAALVVSLRRLQLARTFDQPV